MKVINFVGLFMAILITVSCQKKETVVNPICFDNAKTILIKEDSTFFKGIIMKAKLGDKTILVVRNDENGAETILDDSCNRVYSCCGHACDCATPIWINKIKNKETVWENK